MLSTLRPPRMRYQVKQSAQKIQLTHCHLSQSPNSIRNLPRFALSSKDRFYRTQAFLTDCPNTCISLLYNQSIPGSRQETPFSAAYLHNNGHIVYIRLLSLLSRR